MLMVDVVKNWLIFPRFCVCQLIHANNVLRVVESIEELLLQLFPTIDGLRL